ncbi:hypothetical protein FACS189426_17450 [Bacteroidia bacterium]|nr:hypothetical protein FACS189426_17450 [Bacteroidia bacterium]
MFWAKYILRLSSPFTRLLNDNEKKRKKQCKIIKINLQTKMSNPIKKYRDEQTENKYQPLERGKRVKHEINFDKDMYLTE